MNGTRGCVLPNRMAQRFDVVGARILRLGLGLMQGSALLSGRGEHTKGLGVYFVCRKSKLEIRMRSLSHGDTNFHLSPARARGRFGSAGTQLERA